MTRRTSRRLTAYGLRPTAILMFRKTLTIFSLIGLILSLGLWVVSYWGVEAKCPRPRFTVLLGSGAAFIGDWVSHFYDEPIQEYSFSWGWSSEFRMRWWPSCNFHPDNSSPVITDWKIVVPLWMPALACGLIFFFSQHGGRQRSRRAKRGLCLECGYDLRGSSVRCPECGRALSGHDACLLRAGEEMG